MSHPNPFADWNAANKTARYATPMTEAELDAPAGKVTPDMVAEMRRRREAGETLKAIAKAVGVVHSTVHEWTKDMNR